MKRIFSIIVIVCFVMFGACSNEESASIQLNDQEVLSISERFAVCQEIAAYHSEGLGFVYNKLKSMPNEKINASRAFLYSENQEERMSLINGLVTEFISQKQISSKLAKFDSKIHLENAVEAIQNATLRSSVPVQTKSLSFFDNTVKNVESKESVESTIKAAIRSEVLAAFSEAEQNEALLMLAIFMDSSDYWTENITNWDSLILGTNPDDPTQWVDGSWARIFTIAICDAIGGSNGGIIGGVSGAAGGAAAGALVGGVGAGPGALGGGVAGMVSGYISGAISGSTGAYGKTR